MRTRRAAAVAAVAALTAALAATAIVAERAGPPTGLAPVALPITVPVLLPADPPIPVPLLPPQPSPANPAAKPRPLPACTSTGRPFVPTSVSVPGIADRVTVLPLRRDAHGDPRVPPLSSTGKTDMAFDLGSGIQPGDRRGNALLNAHTWPDGSALGNKLLARLHRGDTVIVQGPTGRICYQVTYRIEVPAASEHSGYFDTTGPPRIAIAVCSGRRLGPGRWTKRTLWFASPTDRHTAAATGPAD